ncbi:hypothetical protein ILUMI_11717 [Ignelater luminosus]|uniref:Uncharacterized protein n=1 Tax=Ignelater luminosus TaxID=2038154 RepID=A0A8K0CVJ8_IGNLU|nr:hypothetical protein ILUMI_11717 [Ignelater luminosus]
MQNIVYENEQVQNHFKTVHPLPYVKANETLNLTLINHGMRHSWKKKSIGFADVLLKALGNCNPNGTDIFKYNLTIKTINKQQYLSGDMKLQGSFNNSLKVNASVEILAGKNYVYLFTIRENKACDALHKYLGEFVYAIERAMGLIPRTCPIPKDTAMQQITKDIAGGPIWFSVDETSDAVENYVANFIVRQLSKSNST